MRSVPRERWSHDTGRSKRMITLLALLPTRLTPRHELTQVAHIVTNRHRAHILRDSRYFGSCLRSKNATGWLHGEREPTSIGQARRRLVHPFAKHRQVSIEHAVVERSEF